MADKTAIEWTDATWNPIRGCTRVSEGCRFCYAESVAARFSGPGQPYEGLAKIDATGNRRWTGKLTIGHNMDAPLKWQRPRRIFVNSMSDLFHESLPIDNIATIFAICVAARHLRGHIFQILTKRADVMWRVLHQKEFWDQVNIEASMHVLHGTDPLTRTRNDARATLQEYGPANPPPGIWLGVSVENQEAANERIPFLLQTPATIRFISVEPFLGPLYLRKIPFGRVFTVDALTGECTASSETGVVMDLIPPQMPSLDWVIAGGESGHAAAIRPMHPDWPRALRDQCATAGVPFFFKQWGEYLPEHDAYERDLKCIESGPPENGMYRVGKKSAGNVLDGRTHQEFPA